MRLSFLFSMLLLVFMGSNLKAQKTASCCNLSAVEQFANLANDLTFVVTHEEPGDYKHINALGNRIKFPISGETDGQGYYIQGSKESKQWIFVIHEWWGLNDYILKTSDQLHEVFPEAHILAIDLYDGNVATTREEAGKLMQSADTKRIEKILTGAALYSGSNSKIATIGWCFGGGWSHKAAILLAPKVNACVIYYGMPVIDVAQLKNLEAPVLGIFAGQDGWITPEKVGEFEKTMKELHKAVEIHSYDAPHAFANPSNPGYVKKDTEDAWSKTISFFKNQF